jgi:type I restriction enzyme S subunit
MDQELERRTMGATVKTIGMPDVRTLVVPVPPVDEQQKIVSHIFKQRERLDTTIRKTRLSIGLMREHRTALISAAVTGKIDVREPTHA